MSAWTREFVQRYCPWGIGTLQLETRVGRIGELVPLVAEQCECDLIALGWSQQLSAGRAPIVHGRSSARSCPFSSFRSSSLRTRSLSSCSRRRRRPDASAARLPRPQRETLPRKRLRSPLTRPPRSPEAEQVSSEFDVGAQAAGREDIPNAGTSDVARRQARYRVIVVEIDTGAPATASGEIEVAATPEILWSVLTDIASWPRWNPDVKTASIDGSFASGTQFRRKAGPGTDHLDTSGRRAASPHRVDRNDIRHRNNPHRSTGMQHGTRIVRSR